MYRGDYSRIHVANYDVNLVGQFNVPIQSYTCCMKPQPHTPTDAQRTPPQFQVRIEISRGSFVKRGTNGQLDFFSPLPCPFNYGSIESHIGLEGDLLDAVVLGRRLPRGTTATVSAFGAIGMTDRGMYDDKIICSHYPLSRWQKAMILAFFNLYAKCKWLLNLTRGRPGRNACEGWGDAEAAVARARPRDAVNWTGPTVPL